MDEKAKVNASYYVTKLLPNLIKDYRHLLSSFSKMAHLLTQQPLSKTGSRRNALVSLEKTNGHGIRQISIHWIIMWGAMLGRYQKYASKPTNIAELKTALLSIWNDLPQA